MDDALRAYTMQMVEDLDRRLSRIEARRPVRLKSYGTGDLPAAGDWPHCVIYVADGSTGPVIAYSDGSAWRRASDGAAL